MKSSGVEADRRGVFIGLAAVATGVLWSSRGQALPQGWSGAFGRASTALAPVGVAVSGGENPDLVAFAVQPLASTEYRQSVNLVGSSLLGIQTAVRDDVASFTHFHDDGQDPVPCVKTTILSDSYATHELFDHNPIPCVKLGSEMLEGGHIGVVEFLHQHPDENEFPVPCIKTTILSDSYATHELFDHNPVPCIKLETEMLEGAHIGAVELVVDDLSVDLTIRVGERTYVLVDDELVEVP